MMKTTLVIAAVNEGPAPAPSQHSLDLHVGGPSVLLRWLETQLGLQQRPRIPRAARVSACARALDLVTDASFARSLRADRWATASELLARRGELRLAGWDEAPSTSLPPLLRDLARARSSTELLVDTTDRLAAVTEALDRGQKLPSHTCCLEDPLETWPIRWLAVLARLQVTISDVPRPRAPQRSALAQAQKNCLEGTSDPISADPSFRWMSARSVAGACEAVASALACSPEQLASTVVCCEDDLTAARLDGALHRLGLPTMGARLRTIHHPVLQLLPLVLRLCWQPVDPSTLLDFLSLPVGPIRRRWARRLSDALVRQPGLGSTAWDEAMSELCSPANDPEGQARDRLHAWLSVDRAPWGSPVSVTVARSCCNRVAQWAAARSHANDNTITLPIDVLGALRLLASQAASLGRILDQHGGEVSEPQLARMLEAVVGAGTTVAPSAAEAGAPQWARTLAEVHDGCTRLVDTILLRLLLERSGVAKEDPLYRGHNSVVQ